MTINSIVTITAAFLAALTSLLGAVQTQKAYKAKKRDRAEKRRQSMKQIMSTSAETIIPDSTLEVDIETVYSDLERMFSRSVSKKYTRPHKYAKLKKRGKLQSKISTDDSASQKQQHIG